MDLFEEWGLNVVRLGVMWPGVQPNATSTDTTYLDRVGRLIDALAKRGIFTIVDLHQVKNLLGNLGSY